MMKRLCEFCGGSGQISYFKGVSRFLLTTEECGVCTGLGYLVSADDSTETEGEEAGGPGYSNQRKNNKR